MSDYLDPDDDAIYHAIERILKPILEITPPVCDSHGRTYVRDGEDHCHACADDGFSGELGEIAVDSTVYEIIAAINEAKRNRKGEGEG